MTILSTSGQSAFSPGVPRILAPDYQSPRRDKDGIEIDPLYIPHVVEYHFMDTTRMVRKGRTPGAAKEPATHGMGGEE